MEESELLWHRIGGKHHKVNVSDTLFENVADIWEYWEERWRRKLRALLLWSNGCYHALADFFWHANEPWASAQGGRYRESPWSSDSTRVTASCFSAVMRQGLCSMHFADQVELPRRAFTLFKTAQLVCKLNQKNPLHTLPYVFLRSILISLSTLA